MNDRLYRSRVERVLGGVCGGLAERMDIDPSLVRVVWVIGTIVTGFVFGILIYVVLLIVVPEAPEGWVPRHRPPYPPAPGPYPPAPGPYPPAPGPYPPAPGPYPPAPPSPDAVPGWIPPDASLASSTGWAPPSAVTGAPPPPDGQPPDTTDTPGTPPTWTAPGDVPPAPPWGGTQAGTDGWAAPDAAYAARRAAGHERRRRNERVGALVFGGLLILFGIWFLVREYIPQVDLGAFWPLVIIALGVLLLVRAVSRGDDAGTGGTGPG